MSVPLASAVVLFNLNEVPALVHSQGSRNAQQVSFDPRLSLEEDILEIGRNPLLCDIIDKTDGSGGGTSGRAMAFCLGRPGSNPGLDFGFFSSELLSIYSHWVSGFF